MELTAEQMEKLRAAKSIEDIRAIVQEEGWELSEEQLDVINGGGTWSTTGNREVLKSLCPPFIW